VRAAEDEGVDLSLDQWIEVLVRSGEQLGPGRHTGLDEVDEPWARTGDQLDLRRGGERVLVCQRRRRRLGADHPDALVAGGGDGPAGGRQDHLDDRYVVPFAGVPQHRGAGGVAGDHEHLHAGVDQVVEAFERVLAHFGDRLRTVGLPGGVTEIEDRLVR
jgi:hypothetical protein